MPKELTPQSIRQTVYRVLSDERYKKNAKAYSEVLQKAAGTRQPLNTS